MHTASRGTRVTVTRRETRFEDRDPTSRYHNAAFPSLVRCPDGSILLVHRVGREKNSADGTQMLWRFQAGEWRSVPWPLDAARPPLRELRTAALSTTADGTLAVLVTWIDHPDFSGPIANPATEGLLPVHIGFSTSVDSGVTWSPLSEIPVAPLEQPCGNGAIRRAQDGRWIAAFELYKHYEDASPWSSRAAAVSSLDGGRTWGRPQILAEDPAFQICYWDLHLLDLKDGSLLGAGWFDDRRKPGQSGAYWIQSKDGVHWSEVSPIGIEGQFIDLLELPDGRIVLCYVTRAGRPAIRIRVASPDPRSWSTSGEHFLYEQGLDDLGGTASFGDYLQGMSRWSFGWPSMLLLDKETLLVAYYSGRDSFSSIQLAEVRVEE